ncbi:MAG: hypothetical protein AAFY41_00305 [Bacteroidota bacterium]
MKPLKYTLIIIASLGLVASVYNFTYDWSVYELIKGVLVAAFLFFSAFNLRKLNGFLSRKTHEN